MDDMDFRMLISDATDDQLRAEWARRFPGNRNILADAMTNAELRAECERRGIDVGACDCAAIDTALQADRDEWRRAADRHAGERDEWKRRAEAAEARLPGRFGGAAGLPQARFDVEYGGCAICGAPPGTRCSKSCDDDTVADAAVTPWAEQGPGIAAKPVTSRDSEDWPDPWDFLEDA